MRRRNYFVGRFPGVVRSEPDGPPHNPRLIGLAHSHSLGPRGPSALPNSFRGFPSRLSPLRVDSFAPARSALRPSVSPNSFRHFPNGSSQRSRSSACHLIRVRKIRVHPCPSVAKNFRVVRDHDSRQRTARFWDSILWRAWEANFAVQNVSDTSPRRGEGFILNGFPA